MDSQNEYPNGQPEQPVTDAAGGTPPVAPPQAPPEPDQTPEVPPTQPEADAPEQPEYLPEALPYSRMYAPPQPPLTTPVRRKKLPILIGLLALLLLAAGIIWLVRSLHITVVKSDAGTTVSFGPREDAQDLPPLEELFEPTDPAEEAPQGPEAAQVGSGAQLALTPSGAAAADALSYQQIYQKVIPSVVSITCTTPTGTGTGTGIVMSEDGYILTNYHVIEKGYQLQVLTYGEMTYDAALVGGDESSDLAVLKVEASGLVPAEFGSSDTLQVGDPVLAIGDPLGVKLRGTMTDGIVSAINRDVDMGDRKLTLIQTNAALNAGNSGGPLVNIFGQVVGVNTMKLISYYTSVEGLGFAIPISAAKPIVDELLEKGYVSGRPAIGIVGGELPAYVAAYYNIPSGIYIQSVTPDSDAARQGLSPGDIITAADGQAVASLDELNAVKNLHAAGDTLQLTVFRNGETFDVGIRLMDAALVN